jgi:hypothetical protein
MCEHVFGWTSLEGKHPYNWNLYIVIKAVGSGTVWNGKIDRFFCKRALKMNVIGVAGY